MREALTNAFVHRDYASGSGSIGVALYDDRLEIISPGELHFGLTPEKLLLPHESKPWNPLIASTFYRRGHIEAWGRGTLKIAELMKAAGQQPPTLVSSDGFVTLIFRRPDSEGVSEGVTALLDLINLRPGLRTPEIAKVLSTSPKNIERWLQQLKAAGKVEFRGAPKTGGYHGAKD